MNAARRLPYFFQYKSHTTTFETSAMKTVNVSENDIQPIG